MQTRARDDGDGCRTHRATKRLSPTSASPTSSWSLPMRTPRPAAKALRPLWSRPTPRACAASAFELSDDHPLGELIFTSCRAEILGEVGDGFKLAMRTLDRFRVSVGAAAVGMARRAFDEAAHHVRTRVQFGKPLAEQQLVQAHLANMATELDAARLMVLRAATRPTPRDERVSREAAMAKLFATEAAQRIVDTGVQLMGGRGSFTAMRLSTCTGPFVRCASTKALPRFSDSSLVAASQRTAK